MSSIEYANILVERRGPVGIVTLNRPQALNALNAALIADLGAAFDDLEGDEAIAAIILTGSERAFAAGADIKEMADKTYIEAYREDFITSGWERVAQCRKPVIAAVAGFALGGGCEIAMMCDIVDRRRQRALRPARDQPRHDAGRRRDAAPAALCRQGQGDGSVPDRADDGCRRGRARRPRQPHRAGRQAAWPKRSRWRIGSPRCRDRSR